MSRSPIQLAAAKSFFKIDWANLTPKDITEVGPDGKTLLHHAAFNGFWDRLPEPLTDKKYWTDTSDGTTIPMLAVHSYSSELWVNPKDLTEDEILKKNKAGECFLSLAIQLSYRDISKIIPKESLTQKALRSEYGNEKIIHLLARNDGIKKIPKKLLTEDLLCLKGRNGDTVYHVLAQEGKISHLPKELLTKKALTTTNDHGLTPLFTIAEKEPSLIPKELLTPEFLHEKRNGETPLHCWLQGEFWMDIPLEVITKESLRLLSGRTVLHHIVDLYDTNRLWFQKDKETTKKIEQLFKKALRLGDTETLEITRDRMKTKEKDYLKADHLKRVSSIIQDELNKRKLITKISQKEASIEI
jgi:hypothetical protein